MMPGMYRYTQYRSMRDQEGIKGQHSLPHILRSEYSHGRVNWRRDEQPIYGCGLRTHYFAPENLLTPDGRRVMRAWLLSASPDTALQKKTIQSLPRESSLPHEGVLRIRQRRERIELRVHGSTFKELFRISNLDPFARQFLDNRQNQLDPRTIFCGKGVVGGNYRFDSFRFSHRGKEG